MDWLNDAKNAIYALIGALFAIGAHVWRKTEGRVEGLEARESAKASKVELGELARRVDSKADTLEMDRQRYNISKIFDKLDDYTRRAEDRHREVLTALHEGLSRKADK